MHLLAFLSRKVLTGLRHNTPVSFISIIIITQVTKAIGTIYAKGYSYLFVRYFCCPTVLYESDENIYLPKIMHNTVCSLPNSLLVLGKTSNETINMTSI